MDRPSDSQTHARSDTPAKSAPLTVRSRYLILYNTLSAILWAIILTRTTRILLTGGKSQNVFNQVGEFTRWTQTLAMLEILHSLTGLVRAPVLTTVMQVASRFLLVWIVVNNFPDIARSTWAYSSMLLAWSTTEVIRYSYFAVNLMNGKVPGWLTWLRYNTFFVLYPLGISSECWIVWKASQLAGRVRREWEWAAWVVLGVYVPGKFWSDQWFIWRYADDVSGSYILFTHMMAQRRRTMRAPQSKKAK